MGHLFGEHQRERSHIKASSSSLCPTQKMEGWRRLPQWALPAFLALLILLPEGNDSKTSRVRTNYKLRVGNKPIGRYTPYSQVRIPATDEFHTEDAKKYYRHPKGARITKASHFDYEYVLGHKIVFICVAKGKPRPKIIWFKGKGRLKSKMEIDPAAQGDAGIYECHANNKW